MDYPGAETLLAEIKHSYALGKMRHTYKQCRYQKGDADNDRDHPVPDLPVFLFNALYGSDIPAQEEVSLHIMVCIIDDRGAYGNVLLVLIRM